MANYLFATIGGRDIQFKTTALTDNPLCIERNGEKTTIFSSPRTGGEIVFNNYCDWKEKLEYPIIEPVIKYCQDKSITLDKLFFIVSNQPSKDPTNTSVFGDTLFFGQIFQKFVNEKYGFRLELIILQTIPPDFNAQFEELNKWFDKYDSFFDYFEDDVIVYNQGGVAETRFSLLLNCIQRFPSLTQLAKPEGRDVEIQGFPGLFMKQIRKNVAPFALKETLATLSARNLSHTDGSHVLPSYQKNLNKALDSILENLEYNFENFKIDQSISKENDLRESLEKGSNKLKKVYNAFENYIRGQMEYLADLSGQTSSQAFFDYDFKNAVDDFQDIINFFLGKGLIDDKKFEEQNVDVHLNYRSGSKTVSLPGGSNGLNAFYTILKNFIRNLYKHSSFVVKTDDGSYCYRVELKLENDELFRDYYKVILWDKIHYTDEELNLIINGTQSRKGVWSCIHDQLLNEDGKVREYGWGILEMKIAAFYLIGLPLTYFDEPVNDKNEIDLSKTKVQGIFPKPFEVVKYDGHLAYEFYLRKPETFCVVTDQKPENKSAYRDVGISFCPEDSENMDCNTRAKFIVKPENKNCKSYKCYNIRQINFFEGIFSQLLGDNERSEIILTWMKEVFMQGSQQISDIKKKGINPDAGQQLNSDARNNFKGKNLIVIDSHGDGHSELSFRDIKDQGYRYYSTCCSRDIRDIPLGDKKLTWEQLEAIFTKVAVLDERIQDRVIESQHYIHNLSKRDLLELRGVFVPYSDPKDGEFVDLKVFFGEKTDIQTVKSFETLLKRYLEEYHYTVLHFTILEKMAAVLKKNIDNYYGQLFPKDKSNSHYLILTSGKGIPSTLPEGAYFINFSTLEQDISALSKVNLVQHLNSVRIYHKPKK